MALVAAARLGGLRGAVRAPQESSTHAPPPPTPPPAKPAPTDVAPKGGLAIGLSEINPDLFWHGKDVGAFDPWRDRAEALKPPLYRLAVDWATLQPIARRAR